MTYRRLVLAMSLGLLTTAAQPAAAAHPHYERLLRDGSFALERGDAAGAARELRLACFGFLEEVERLADCLARLAVAQAAAGDDEGFRESFRRVVEVEEAYAAYGKAEISPATRATFEAEVVRLVPPRILSETAPFAHLAAAPDEPAATTGQEAASEPLPAPAPAVPPPGELAQGPEVAPVAAPARPDLTADEEASLDSARELLGVARERRDLDEPWRLARAVADANPEVSRAQHLTAVIAYRAARWEDAVTYFRRGGDPDPAAPETLFYFAVSLYEAGEPEDAARVLRQSLPWIEHTPFVLSYRDKILGTDQAGNG